MRAPLCEATSGSKSRGGGQSGCAADVRVEIEGGPFFKGEASGRAGGQQIMVVEDVNVSIPEK